VADAFLDAVLDSSDDAIVRLDASGAVVAWNRGARRLSGYSEGEAEGRSLVSLLAEHRRRNGEDLVERAVQGDRIERAETDLLRKDGLVVPIWLTLTPIVDVDGEVTGIAALARDVSEQQLAAATLAESEERLRESELLAHMGAWLWDGDAMVQWSDGMYQILRVDPLSFEGTLEAHLAFVHDDDRDTARKQLAGALDQRRAFETEYRIVRTDGETRWTYVRGQPVVDGSGRPQGMTGIYQDISERRQAEQDRRRLSEAQLRQLQAREINDEIVQRLVVAQLAFELNEIDRATNALHSTLSTARRLVTELLGEGPVEPGSLRRTQAS
jgi:PAS domain S-box-containing protein